jgi:hypothetical protein
MTSVQNQRFESQLSNPMACAALPTRPEGHGCAAAAETVMVGVLCSVQVTLSHACMLNKMKVKSDGTQHC